VPVAFEDGELATTGQEPAAAGCDRGRRRSFVLLVLLGVGYVGSAMMYAGMAEDLPSEVRHLVSRAFGDLHTGRIRQACLLR
jgi:hypothetical protein